MSLAFNPKEGLIIIPTRILGPNGDAIVRLALDSGATSSMVNWDVIVFLGYDPAIVSARVQMTTGSGVEFAPRISLQRIEALQKVLTDFPIICHTLPPSATVDGVLGLDFLRDTKLIIDFRRGEIAME